MEKPEKIAINFYFGYYDGYYYDFGLLNSQIIRFRFSCGSAEGSQRKN